MPDEDLDATIEESARSTDNIAKKSEHYEDSIGINLDTKGLFGAQRSEPDVTNPVYEDPTQIISTNLPEYLPVEGAFDIQDTIKKIFTQRIIVLSCPDDDVAKSAFLRLCTDESLDNYQKREFDSNDEQHSARDDIASSLTNPVRIGDQEHGHKTLIGISLGHDIDLYNELLGTAADRERTSQRLKELDRIIILLFTPNILKIDKKTVDHINIDYILPLITQKVKDQERAEKLYSTIQDQRQGGLWPADEDEFLIEFNFFLRLPEERALENAIEVRSHDSKEGRSHFLNEKIKLQDFFETFDNSNKLNQTLLYVATFFSGTRSTEPGLGVNEFSEVANTLIQGEAVKLTRKGKVIDPLSSRKKKKSDQKVDLLVQWQLNKDQLLRENKLVVVNRKNGAAFVDFNYPIIRAELRNHLHRNHAYFLTSMFEKIQQHGLLFHESDRVSDSVIYLIIEMISRDPRRYDDQWLFEMISYIGQEIEHPLHYVSLEDVLREHIKNLQGDYRHFIFIRITNLLKGLCLSSEFDQTVKRFMERLIRARMFETTLSIASRMRNISGFDTLYWIKQAIDRGDNDARTYAFNILNGQLFSSGTRMGELLETLMSWMPEAGKPPENYSRANELTVSLLLNFLLNSTLEFKVENYGKWPIRHKVLSQLLDKQSLQENLLTRIMSHSALREVLMQSISADDLYDLLVGKWHLTLRGVDYTVATNQLAQSMFTHLAEQTLSSLQNELINNEKDIKTALHLATRHHIRWFRDQAQEIIPVLIAEWYLIIYGLESEMAPDKEKDAFRGFLVNLVSLMNKSELKDTDRSWLHMTQFIREIIQHVKSVGGRNRNQIITPLLQKRQRINELRRLFIDLQKVQKTLGES